MYKCLSMEFAWLYLILLPHSAITLWYAMWNHSFSRKIIRWPSASYAFAFFRFLYFPLPTHSEKSIRRKLEWNAAFIVWTVKFNLWIWLVGCWMMMMGWAYGECTLYTYVQCANSHNFTNDSLQCYILIIFSTEPTIVVHPTEMARSRKKYITFSIISNCFYYYCYLRTKFVMNYFFAIHICTRHRVHFLCPFLI